MIRKMKELFDSLSDVEKLELHTVTKQWSEEKRLEAALSIELTDEEKMLAEQPGKVKAIKALKDRCPGLSLQTCLLAVNAYRASIKKERQNA